MLISQQVSAQSPPKNFAAFSKGDPAGLKEAQISRLLALRIPVAIPIYIPQGFQLEEVKIEKDQYSTGYTLHYKNNRGAKFAIQSTNEGIGSVDTVKTIKDVNPYFSGQLMIGYQAEAKTEIWGEWVENKRQVSGFKNVQYYSLLANKLPLQEAMKIMKSLRYLQK
jgi:hypothetical protein